MAGVKGKSGGPRKNSGGARPGAGRKPKAKPAAESANGGAIAVTLEPQPHGGALKRSKADAAPTAALPETDEPLKFLLAVQNSSAVDIKTRVRAAIAAAQYKHTKRGDGGKKDEAADKAKRVAGRFTPSAPPKLVAAGGKKV